MSKITIGKKEYEVSEVQLNQCELLFYEENPRVYSALRADGSTPTQEVIEEKMTSMDHVKQLRLSIEQNGGLIDPLMVVKRNDDYIVLEGNSRLAAYRLLAAKDPVKWQKVRACILPEEITDGDIFTLLGQYHLVGRKDWSELIDAVSRAFNVQVQNDMFVEVMAAGEKLPTNEQFNVTRELAAANKDRFDELISDVSSANDGASVVIMGLKTDLKKLSALTDIDWVTEDQKKEVAEMGRLGSYEGTTLVEIPQRFALNDVTKKLITPGKLLIMPAIEDKFVKLVDEGETEINEVGVGEKAVRMDDTQVYEVQRGFGIITQIGRYFATWTF